MNVRVQLQALLQYYVTNRQVGHTTAMLRGANNTKCTVIVAREHNYRRLMDLQQKRKKGKKYNATTLAGVEHGNLLGHREPIVFDNEALWELFGAAHKRITELENKIESIKIVVGN